MFRFICQSVGEIIERERENESLTFYSCHADTSCRFLSPQKETLSTLIEAHTITLLLELLSLPVPKFTGTITTGATSSNILGLACGRESVLRTLLSKPGQGEFSFSEQGFSEAIPAINIFVACSHASVKKAAALVGIGRARVKDLGRKSNVDVSSDDLDEEKLAESRAKCLDFDLESL